MLTGIGPLLVDELVILVRSVVVGHGDAALLAIVDNTIVLGDLTTLQLCLVGNVDFVVPWVKSLEVLREKR